MVANHAHVEEEIVKLNTMASERIKSVKEMRKKNYKAMIEMFDLEIRINIFCWINEKALNEIENSSG